MNCLSNSGLSSQISRKSSKFEELEISNGMNDSYEKCFSLMILLLAGTSLWMIVFVELGLILVACEDNSLNIKRKY